jgi:chromosome segregation ATPase
MYKTDQSQLGDQDENIPRNEFTLSIDVENMLRSFQESIKKQQELEKILKTVEQEKIQLATQNTKIQNQYKKSEAQKNILLEQINNLNKEVAQKQNLSTKCMNLEQKLKVAESALKKMDSNLKNSESKRYSLSRKLEDKINENIENSKRLREQY